MFYDCHDIGRSLGDFQHRHENVFTGKSRGHSPPLPVSIQSSLSRGKHGIAAHEHFFTRDTYQWQWWLFFQYNNMVRGQTQLCLSSFSKYVNLLTNKSFLCVLAKTNISRLHQSIQAWICQLHDSLLRNWWNRTMFLLRYVIKIYVMCAKGFKVIYFEYPLCVAVSGC